jgi:hypothetical protein
MSLIVKSNVESVRNLSLKSFTRGEKWVPIAFFGTISQISVDDSVFKPTATADPSGRDSYTCKEPDHLQFLWRECLDHIIR